MYERLKVLEASMVCQCWAARRYHGLFKSGGKGRRLMEHGCHGTAGLKCHDETGGDGWIGDVQVLLRITSYFKLPDKDVPSSPLGSSTSRYPSGSPVEKGPRIGRHSFAGQLYFQCCIGRLSGGTKYLVVHGAVRYLP